MRSLLGNLKFKKDEIDYESAAIDEFMHYADTVFIAYQEQKILPHKIVDYLLNSYNTTISVLLPQRLTLRQPTMNINVCQIASGG